MISSLQSLQSPKVKNCKSFGQVSRESFFHENRCMYERTQMAACHNICAYDNKHAEVDKKYLLPPPLRNNPCSPPRDALFY